MRNYIITGICLLGAVCFSNGIKAQDTNTDNHTISIEVPEVALLDIEASATKNISMNFTSTGEAGDALKKPDDNSSLWLNYSSIVSGTATRTVTVSVDAPIDGIDINLKITGSTTGAGTLGTVTPDPITLTASPATIITGIGSCYTVSGASSGCQLTYSLAASATNYGNIKADTYTPKVTYTISNP